ncbi:MAG: BatA domain-containing protein [Sedimentisphaerales bacterium]|nr:BatA domain-containing protein [Sedimentisphaerales bacterium]
MTFLNAILLGGMVAGAIPVIIHIINRNRFRQIRWGAMHLLEQILRIQKRRLRIEQLLLLLVRIAIPVLLALCMARPVLTGIETLKGRAKTSLVVLLDNSYSMNAVAPGGSHFNQAKAHINTIVNALPRGSEITVAWMTGRQSARLGPTFDQNRMRGMLAAKKQGFGTADAAAAIEAASGICAGAHYKDRDLVIMSDFQKLTWDSDTAEARQRALDLVANIPLPPAITLFRTGKEVTENVAVESLDVSRPIIGVAQNLRIRAAIKNHGKTTFEDMRVYFRVDSENRSASQMTLGPGESGQVVFSHEFDSPGSHVVEIYADADPLKADNVKRFSIPVWDKLPVLLVSGDTNPQPLQAETAFLQIALQPFTSAAATLSDLITTRLITPDKLTAKELMEHRVVVLANVPRLSDLQIKIIEDYVRRGGGLLVFCGDRIDPDWYNNKMVASATGLLPCEFAQVVDSETLKTLPAGIVAQHYDHQALEFFNDPRNGSLQGIKLQTWYKLAAPQSTRDTSVIAHLDSADPFLVEKQFGKGRVIQCCTACDDDWSNLPARPAYLPMMQQLVTYLASTVYPPRNVNVGQQLAALLPPENAGKTAVLTDPEGKRHELSAILKDDHCLVEFADTELPGLYVLETPENETIHFVVNTSSEESDLTLLDDTEFAELAMQMKAKPVSSAQQYLQFDQRRRFGREMWKWLLAAVLLLVFVEILLQQRFGMVKNDDH